MKTKNRVVPAVLRTMFIKTAAGAAIAEKLGYVTKPGTRHMYCSCGCGEVLGQKSGYEIVTSASRGELESVGLLVSSCNFMGIY